MPIDPAVQQELVKNGAMILTALGTCVSVILGAITAAFSHRGKELAKEAVAETKAGNAVTADVAASVNDIANQTATTTAATCENYTRLMAENASLRAENDRLKSSVSKDTP